MERFELYWGELPEGPVEMPVVVPVDPAGRRELDVREIPGDSAWSNESTMTADPSPTSQPKRVSSDPRPRNRTPHALIRSGPRVYACVDDVMTSYN